MRVISTLEYDEERDAIAHDWMKYLVKLGYLPILIPNIGDEISSYLDNVNPDLIILTGGNDIGESEIRDYSENEIIKYSINNKIPMLGVCRGLQMINIFFGGNIIKIENHSNTIHKINISSELENFYSKELTVNSYHNYGIDSECAGKELKQIAWDEEGYIESMKHEKYPIIGIMWHPERQNIKSDIHLINFLLNQ